MSRSPLLRRSARRTSGVLVAAAALLAACGGGTSTPTANAQTLGKGPTVNLKSLQFQPSKLNAKVGDTVTWVWREKVAHNVVFDDKVKSKILSKGSYTRKFTKAGKYKYVCTLHPTMKGEVTVK